MLHDFRLIAGLAVLLGTAANEAILLFETQPGPVSEVQLTLEVYWDLLLLNVVPLRAFGAGLHSCVLSVSTLEELRPF